MEPAYDAFISYSRADRVFANSLKKTLESYRAPKDLGLPQRHLKIFRDESDFTGVDYFASIRKHLGQSRSLILVCSPDARRSQYVNDEIRRFVEARGAGRIVPVICAGIPNNEASSDRDAEKAFPDALYESMEMPLAVDYRGFDAGKDRINKGAFENPWYTLLANLFDLDRNEIEQRDKRRQARQRRWQIAIAGAFFAIVSIGLVVSLFYWRQAVIARNQALSRELAAGSLGQLETDPDLSVKLAIEALRISPTQQAEAALRESLSRHQVLAVMIGNRRIDTGALSPDGRYFAAGGYDRKLRVWNVQTGDLIAELPGHEDIIVDSDFSPDGLRVATASWDNTARIWDVAAKRVQHTLPDHGATVTSVRFSHDGRLVATGDGHGKVRIWDAVQGALIRKIDAHSWEKSIVQGATRVVFNPDDSQLLTSGGVKSTATGDPVARLWSADTSALIREFPTKGGEVVVSQFSRDGKRALIVSTRDNPRVWEVSTGKPLGELRGNTGLVEFGALSPDGESVVTSDTNGNGAIWDAQSGKARTTMVGGIGAAAFDETGKRVAIFDGNGLGIWDAHSGALLQTLLGHGGINVVVFGRAPETLITAGEDGSARVWSLRSATKEWEFTLRDGAEEGPLFSRDGTLIMARSQGTAMVWDVSSGKELARFESFYGWAAFDRNNRVFLVDRSLSATQVGRIESDSGAPTISTVKIPDFVVAESPDGKLVLTVADPFLAEVRNSESWEKLSILRGHQGPVKSAVFAPDSRWVMTVGEDGKVAVWDVASGRLEHDFGLDNRGYIALISPDGRWASAVADWSSITVWDTSTWQPAHKYIWTAPAAGGNWAKSAAFSPDSTLLAVGDDRGQLRILDVMGGKTLATIQSHKAQIRSVAFNENGRMILTSSDGDRGARVWDSKTGAKLAELGMEFLRGAAFSPDGSRVATFSSSGQVRFFNSERFTPVGQLVTLASQRVKRDWTPGERVRFLHETPQ